MRSHRHREYEMKSIVCREFIVREDYARVIVRILTESKEGLMSNIHYFIVAKKRKKREEKKNRTTKHTISSSTSPHAHCTPSARNPCPPAGSPPECPHTDRAGAAAGPC